MCWKGESWDVLNFRFKTWRRVGNVKGEKNRIKNMLNLKCKNSKNTINKRRNEVNQKAQLSQWREKKAVDWVFSILFQSFGFQFP